MLILRLALVLVAMMLVGSGTLYILTRKQRYLNFAVKTVRITVFSALIFALLFILERYVLVGWRVML